MTPEQIERDRARKYKWVADNIEKVRETNRISYHKHKEARAITRRLNKEKIAERQREYYNKNADKIRERAARFYTENKEWCAQRKAAHYQQNKATYVAAISRRRKERMKEDPAYRLSVRYRSSVNRLIMSGWVRTCRSAELLGCTWQEVRAHLEKRFAPGMTWENYGIKGWHIDHIRPLASFNLTDDAQARQAFHYTNLQPLWAKDNLAKRAKWAA